VGVGLKVLVFTWVVVGVSLPRLSFVDCRLSNMSIEMVLFFWRIEDVIVSFSHEGPGPLADGKDCLEERCGSAFWRVL